MGIVEFRCHYCGELKDFGRFTMWVVSSPPGDPPACDDCVLKHLAEQKMNI